MNSVDLLRITNKVAQKKFLVPARMNSEAELFPGWSRCKETKRNASVYTLRWSDVWARSQSAPKT